MRFLVITETRVGRRPNAEYASPNEHQRGALRPVTAVFLNGWYPDIRRDYEQAGIPVYSLRERPELLSPIVPPPEANSEETRNGSDQQE